MASIKQRSRKDGSPYFDVMFRLDGRQRSVSFQTEAHAQKFRNLIELVGVAKAMEVYNLNSPRVRSITARASLSGWSTTSIT